MTSPSNANVSDHRDFSKHSEVGGEPQENDHTVTSGDDASSSESPIHTKQEQLSIWRRAYEIVYWVPPKARYDPNEPPKFSMAMNVLFAFAGAFTVANLYYNHPILNILAEDFGVPYEKVSQIPTLAQAGYAVGLFFLCPLGDLFKRRPFVLSLVFFTATMRYEMNDGTPCGEVLTTSDQHWSLRYGLHRGLHRHSISCRTYHSDATTHVAAGRGSCSTSSTCCCLVDRRFWIRTGHIDCPPLVRDHDELRFLAIRLLDVHSPAIHHIP